MKKINLEKNKITIRPVKMTDSEALTSMVNSLVREKAFTVLQKKTTKKEEEKYLKSLLKEIKAGRDITFVLDFDGRAVGSCGICKNDSVIRNHIGDVGIVLSAEARGLGLGEKLFRKVLEEGIKKFKFKIIQLDVFSENKPAIGLYEKVGFKTVGTIKKGGIHFGKCRDKTIMVKYL
jgi:putative acetyltransferase